MSYRCEILADSVGPHGIRLTTFQVTFPQIVLRDYTRHRALSYSFESTRAVPLEKRLEMVKENPFIPNPFRSRAKGMGGGAILTGSDAKWAEDMWLTSRDSAVEIVEAMEPNEDMKWPGICKELAGRLIEPFGWITGIISGTEWANFFALRCPPEGEKPDPKFPAQYELQVIADMQREAYRNHMPRELHYGEWHLPLWNEGDVYAARENVTDELFPAKVSAGRCATVSYLQHHTGGTVNEAYGRWERKLMPFAHWSPGEHPAQCVPHKIGSEYVYNTGNYTGFRQLRKFYPGEAIHDPQ